MILKQIYLQTWQVPGSKIEEVKKGALMMRPHDIAAHHL